MSFRRSVCATHKIVFVLKSVCVGGGVLHVHVHIYN
jgi:hypothetical protein